MNSQKPKPSNFILLIALLTISGALAQSPWTQKKGEAYTQVGFSTIPNYTDLYGDPNFETERTISDNTFQLYGEYGITDKTTLLLNVPLKNISAGELNLPAGDGGALTIEETVTSLGNITAGVRHNFYNKKWLVSGQLDVSLNTGTYNELSGIRTGYDAFTFTPLVSVGRGFDQFYVQAFTGVDLRTNDYSSNFKIGGEAGAKILKRIWVIAFLDVVTSFENGDFATPLENTLTGLYVNDQEFTGFGLKTIVEATPRLGFIAGFGSVLSDANNNVPRQASYNFGLYFKFNKNNK
ncbi:MAG: hypothetical protein AAF466_14700 [Bacteroidota bacterium]